ncbi:MAG TPA: phage holin family protein [Lacisediminihabitans sp.]|uniref:phage holin family protein n=1 Tax=Lacisediminihabitans sp. TaxID=2787631 RepID=UPI002ED9F7C6
MSDEGYTRRPLLRLIADIPRLLIQLVKDEIEQLKQEMIAKLKHAAIGIGLLVGAALFGFFLLAVLLTAAVLGFAVIVPAWAAALIVAAILLVIVVILALVGIRQLKKGVPPAPTETIKSVKKDVRTIKGLGKRAKP